MSLKTSSDTFIPTPALQWHEVEDEETIGRNAVPKTNDKTVFQEIDENEYNLKQFEENDFENEAQTEETKHLFLPNSRLGAYDGTIDCKENENFFWFEHVTDRYPDASTFEVKNFKEWYTIKTTDYGPIAAPKFKTYELDPVGGYFEWGKDNSNGVIRPLTPNAPDQRFHLTYYSTCIPKDICILMSVGSNNGGRLRPPGRLKLSINEEPYASTEGHPRDYSLLSCYVGDTCADIFTEVDFDIAKSVTAETNLFNETFCEMKKEKGIYEGQYAGVNRFGSYGTCVDTYPADCKDWEAKKICLNTPGYMRVNCPRSCGLCSDQVCEGHNLDEAKCKKRSCCQWDEGKCSPANGVDICEKSDSGYDLDEEEAALLELFTGFGGF